MGGQKSDDPVSPAYVPSLFSYVKSPMKRVAEQNLVRYSRVQQSKRRRIDAVERGRREAEEREQHEAAEKEREKHEAEERERERHEDEEGEQERYEADEREHKRYEVDERNLAADALLELSMVKMCCDSSTMTQVTMDELTQSETETINLREENDHLQSENVRLKEENAVICREITILKKAMITPETLMEDNAKVKYYTGLLSYSIFKAIFDFVSPCITNYSRTTLPPFNQFLSWFWFDFV